VVDGEKSYGVGSSTGSGAGGLVTEMDGKRDRCELLLWFSDVDDAKAGSGGGVTTFVSNSWFPIPNTPRPTFSAF
jgi:hypothetical protein